MIEVIRKYISKDLISYAHIDELLTRDHTIIYASENGFIIHDDKVDFTYISFSNEEEMKKVLSEHKYEHYLSYDIEVVKFFNDVGNTINLIQWVYDSKEKFDVSEYDIRKLGIEYLDQINSVYKAIGPGEDNKDAVVNGEVLGLFEDNKLAGMIGRHPEGCMGMLLVFEEYRGKGYGIALEKAKINDLIDRGLLVLDEVVEGNDVSTTLQTKLGLTRGEKKIYWKL